MSTELATAWIRLVPSSEGTQGALVNELSGAGNAAGAAGGAAAATQFRGSFGRMLGAAALTAGVVGAFRGLYSVGDTWEDVTNTIKVGTGAQGDALDGLVDDTKTVARQIPADIGEVGESITALNTLTGESGDSLQDLSTSVLEASRMLGEDGVANSEAFGQSMSQWQIPAEDGPGIMDALFKSTQDYGMGLDEVMGHLGRYGSVLNNAGFSMEESAALFGQLESSGLSVSRVMPGLNSAFRDWAAEGKDVQEELYGTVDAIADAETSSEALALATEEFGAEGAQRLTTAIRSGNFEVADLSEALAGADGLIDETAESTMEFSDHWQVLQNNASAALEPLASMLVEGLGGAFQTVTPYLLDFTQFLAENEWILATLAGLIATTVVAAMVTWTASIWAATAALLANPVTWVVVGITALIAAIVALIMNFDTVVAFLHNIFGAAIEWVQGLLSSFASWWSGIWDSITSFLSTAMSVAMGLLRSLLQGGVDFAQGLVSGFSAFWSATWSAISSLLSSILSGAMGLLRSLLQGGVNFAQSIVSGFSAFWSATWSTISSLLSSILSGAMNLLRSLIQGGVSGAQSIVQGFASFWSATWSAILSVLTGIGSSILSFLTSTWSGLLSGAQTGVGNLMSFIGELPSRIIDIFGNAGSWLLDAGGQIISGFLDGITNGFGAVQDTLSGLTDMLPDWKGPPARDEVLLRDAGGLVMGGFTDGLEDEYASVEGSLGRFTERMPDAVRAPSNDVHPGGGSGAGGGLTVQGPLVEIGEVFADSDDRTKELAQNLFTRASRAARSKGGVSLEGAVQ